MRLGSNASPRQFFLSWFVVRCKRERETIKMYCLFIWRFHFRLRLQLNHECYVCCSLNCILCVFVYIFSEYYSHKQKPNGRGKNLHSAHKLFLYDLSTLFASVPESGKKVLLFLFTFPKYFWSDFSKKKKR